MGCSIWGANAGVVLQLCCGDGVTSGGWWAEILNCHSCNCHSCDCQPPADVYAGFLEQLEYNREHFDSKIDSVLHVKRSCMWSGVLEPSVPQSFEKKQIEIQTVWGKYLNCLISWNKHNLSNHSGMSFTKHLYNLKQLKLMYNNTKTQMICFTTLKIDGNCN